MAGKAGKGDKVGDKVGGGEKCAICSSVFKDKEIAVQCEVCFSWSHIKCEGISEEGYKVVQKDNIHWYCVGCNKGVGKLLTMLSRMITPTAMVQKAGMSAHFFSRLAK